MKYSEKIEIVKKIPIPVYMRDEVVPKLGSYYGSGEGYFEYGRVEKCPLHNEDTGSFRYYEETNSCSCFGCRRGGDVVNLHRLFYEINEDTEISFKEAVDYLYAKYVTKEIVDAAVIATKKKTNSVRVVESGDDKIEESSIEVMRALRKVKEAETRIVTTEHNSGMRAKKTKLFWVCKKLHRLGLISSAEISDIALKM